MKAIATFGLVCCLAALPALAQSDAVVRPEVKVGDRWLYHGTDFRKKQSTGTREERVTFVSGEVIHTVVSIFGKDEETDATYTSSWGAVSSFDGGVITPSTGSLRFPLRAGESYAADFENRRPRRGDFRVTHKRTARVVGWEEVTVPAGRFRALKVEIHGTFQRHDRNFAGKTRTVLWYVPAVKRWVKMTYEDSNQHGPVQAYGDELVNYKVQ